MPPSHVEWTPGIVILVAGLLIGAVIVWRVIKSKKKTRPAVDSLELRDLEAKRDALIQQLQDLDEDAAQLSPEVRASERRRLELEAATTLRSIDQLRKGSKGAKRPKDRPVEGQVDSQAPVTAAAAPPAASATRGFLWGIGLATAVALLVFFVNKVATERTEGAGLTGNLPEVVQTQPDPELTQLLAAVQQNPDDTNARLQLAFAYLVRENLMEVYNHTQYVLERVPGEPRALTYQSLVRLAMGQGDLAESMLKQALATEPNLLDARIHLALVYMQMGRQDEATEVMKEAMERHPEEKETLTNLLAEIRASMTAPASGGGASQMSAPAAPPTAQPPAPAGGAGSVSGVLDIDPSARSAIQPGATVFILARPAGVTAGPPVAAKRLVISGFPIQFQLSAADSMMGQALPASMRIDARIDVDGDAATRGEREPSAALDNVPLGSAALQLMLR